MNFHMRKPIGFQSLGLILTVIVLWAIGPLFVKNFTLYYDVWTQNAFRYVCATVALMAFAVAGPRRPTLRFPRRLWGPLLLVVGANVGMQSLFGMVYYYLYPSVATLVGQLAVIMVIALSFFLFRDERRVIRSPLFIAGSLLALLGVATVIWRQDPATMRQLRVTHSQFMTGIGLVVLWSFFSALYIVTIKRVVREMKPVAAFTNVAWMTTLCLVAMMLSLGRPQDLWRQPVQPLLGLVWTGVLCIAVAHVLYYVVIRRVKVVIVVTLMQLVPVLTCALSAAWYGDHLSPLQSAGGAVTLIGAWLASMARAGAETRREGSGKILAEAGKAV